MQKGKTERKRNRRKQKNGKKTVRRGSRAQKERGQNSRTA